MQTRIPSSLKWLVDKRGRLAAKIARYTNQAGVAKLVAADLERRVQGLRKDLRAIDRALGMHEVGLDPATIAAIGTYEEPRLLPPGHLTRRILMCLRRANSKWRSTSEIMAYITMTTGIEVNAANQTQVRLCIRRRLRNLHAAGRVVRQHGVKTSREGYWALPADDED